MKHNLRSYINNISSLLLITKLYVPSHLHDREKVISFSQDTHSYLLILGDQSSHMYTSLGT